MMSNTSTATEIGRLTRNVERQYTKGDTVIAERDRLIEAIKSHRYDIWGDGPVNHSSDLDLYNVLEEVVGNKKNV